MCCLPQIHRLGAHSLHNCRLSHPEVGTYVFIVLYLYFLLLTSIYRGPDRPRRFSQACSNTADALRSAPEAHIGTIKPYMDVPGACRFYTGVPERSQVRYRSSRDRRASGEPQCSPASSLACVSICGFILARFYTTFCWSDYLIDLSLSS